LGLFLHANVKWRFRWVEWLVATPGFHHWHHTNDRPEVINKNYAAMLPWVDKCFGTLYLPREWPVTYGTDTPIASHLAGQLFDPLRQPDPALIQPAVQPALPLETA
jgi:sterol desaturase/sphingolipid hydroxylase (fatty acid hydroxylase superfamily)